MIAKEISLLLISGWIILISTPAGRMQWIFYEHTFFNTIYEGMSQYIFKQVEQCHQIDYGLAGKVSSLQFAGNGESYKMSSLTIYKGVNFQGSFESGQAYTEGEIPEVQLKTQMSLILTGNLPFEIYAEPNYEGGSFCLIPPPSPYLNPLAIEDLWGASIAYDSIRSVKIGCLDIDPSDAYLRAFFRLISRR
ncbi:unnamed protein product [Allacma fusca]|uniref:Uncharacterized protein n=1 Tax=Allacma fusca TaxID=39272 RepID=A0A8J2ME84_9HEXA|nr:unnamed protein product [Allacma fusca]